MNEIRPRLRLHVYVYPRYPGDQPELQVVLHGHFGPLYDVPVGSDLKSAEDRAELKHIRETYGVAQHRIRKAVHACRDAQAAVALMDGSDEPLLLRAPEDEFPIHGAGQ